MYSGAGGIFDVKKMEVKKMSKIENLYKKDIYHNTVIYKGV